MRLFFTQKIIDVYIKKWLFILLASSLFCGNLWSQTFVNGNLSTGPISSNGVTAPSGYTWSETQYGNNTIGWPCHPESHILVSDDFIIPEGETWNITDIIFYAYLINYTGSSSPFNDVRLQIFSTDPSVGFPTPIFGDTITNRFLSSEFKGMHRIFFGQATNFLPRKIYSVNTNAAISLTSGHYWAAWQIGTYETRFLPVYVPSTIVVGTPTQPGNNAYQYYDSIWHTIMGNSVTSVPSNPQDLAFDINYTTGCANPTIPIVDASSFDICAGESTTLSINSGDLNNAANWEWYRDSCGGTIAGTGVSITVSPTSTTTYFVRGVGGCISIGDCAEININVNEIISAPADTSICIGGEASFSINTTGNNLTYQWQYSNNYGTTWMDVQGPDYSGINSSTLKIVSAKAEMDSLLFRVVFSNTVCQNQISSSAMFTTLPGPDVTINPGAYSALYPGLSTTLTANVNPPPASSYQWFLNGSAIPGATNQTYIVDVDGIGVYTVSATSYNGCYALSSLSVTIRDSANTQLFIYPSPTTGLFTVRYWAGSNSRLKPEALTIFDAKGSRIFTQHYNINQPFQEMKVDMTRYSRGVYWVELTDKNGKRIKTGKVLIQ